MGGQFANVLTGVVADGCDRLMGLVCDRMLYARLGWLESLISNVWMPNDGFTNLSARHEHPIVIR